MASVMLRGLYWLLLCSKQELLEAESTLTEPNDVTGKVNAYQLIVSHGVYLIEACMQISH